MSRSDAIVNALFRSLIMQFMHVYMLEWDDDGLRTALHIFLGFILHITFSFIDKNEKGG